ncbi:MAG: hypothetical protein WB586_12205 [Chthoniobacterales bacterium]
MKILQGWGNSQPQPSISDFLKTRRGKQSYGSLPEEIMSPGIFHLDFRQASLLRNKVK